MAKARAITLKDAYAPVSNRAGSRSVLKRVHWRSDLRVRASTLMAKAQPFRVEATYTPIANRASSRSLIDLRCQIFILKQVMIVIHAKRG